MYVPESYCSEFVTSVPADCLNVGAPALTLPKPKDSNGWLGSYAPSNTYEDVVLGAKNAVSPSPVNVPLPPAGTPVGLQFAGFDQLPPAGPIQDLLMASADPENETATAAANAAHRALTPLPRMNSPFPRAPQCS